MEAMNFPKKFRAWFLMFHKGATTRLIIGKGKLSEPISLLISLRQGCPFAMPAYVIQYEPFLCHLDRVLAGVTFGNPSNTRALKESGEAFADDNVNISTSIKDLGTFDSSCKKYEEMSGAKLSRNHKSEILFLGAWKNPAQRPPLHVAYLKENKYAIYAYIHGPVTGSGPSVVWP